MDFIATAFFFIIWVLFVGSFLAMCLIAIYGYLRGIFKPRKPSTRAENVLGVGFFLWMGMPAAAALFVAFKALLH